jgi:hypothetical protein
MDTTTYFIGGELAAQKQSAKNSNDFPASGPKNFSPDAKPVVPEQKLDW